jgi:Amt family ammonium transporter
MDFCIGSVAFWAIGYSLMYGTSIGSVIELQVGFLIAQLIHSLFFQTVFAATAATIVSGAIAERTKFTTYLIFSLLMTLLIYQFLVAGFGMLEDGFAKMGFDFAGSSVVHSVGGWASLVALL